MRSAREPVVKQAVHALQCVVVMCRACMAAHFKPGCDANALPHAADGGLLRPVHDGRARRLQCIAHGSHGISLAAGCARAIADMVQRQTPAIDMQAFSPQRF